MTPEWSGWSAFILAIAGLIGAVSAVFLNRRGQRQQAIQQEAANELAERAQGFVEMERLAEARKVEIDRVNMARDQDVARQERELATMARRCHAALDQMVLALTNIRSQVASEDAKREADLALFDIEQHNAADHPEPKGDA